MTSRRYYNSFVAIHDFSNLPALQKLKITDFLFNDPISESNFDKLPELIELNLQYNQFNNSSIPNFNNPKLKNLNLSFNNFNGVIPNFENVPPTARVGFNCESTNWSNP